MKLFEDQDIESKIFELHTHSAVKKLLFRYALSLATILLILGTLFYAGLEFSFENSLKKTLTTIALDLKNDLLAHQNRHAPIIEPKEAYPLSPLFIEIYRLEQGRAERIFFTKNMRQHRFAPLTPGFSIEEIPFVSTEDESALLVYPLQKEGVRYRIAIAVPIDKIDDTLEIFTTLLFLFGSAIFSILLHLGYRTIERVLAPMRTITETAATISQSNLTKRIPLPKEKDEFFELAHTFNTMLERLEEAFQQERRFNASVSHELKTPLTIIRGEIEVTLMRQRQPQEYVRVLQSIMEEVEKLQSLIEMMLLLSKLENGRLQKRFSTISLQKVVEEAINQVRPMAIQKQIRFIFQKEDAILQAEPTLLRHAILNLLNNAIKFSPPQKKITIILHNTQENIKLHIDDQGPGIPQSCQKKIFEAYYRIEKNGSPTGYGLGLAIMQQIIALHNAQISIHTTKEGTRFTIHFLKRK